MPLRPEEAPLSDEPPTAPQRLRDRLLFAKLPSWRRKPDDAGTPATEAAARPSPEPVVAAVSPQSYMRRQDSERRECLEALDLTPVERRARKRAQSAVRARPIRPTPLLRMRSSAPDISASPPTTRQDDASFYEPRNHVDATSEWIDSVDSQPPSLEEQHSDSDSYSDVLIDDTELRQELESRWILNLSMAFRDKSDREKFFLTYAPAPNRWRRVTVSCDYRHAQPGTLEADLKSLHYQKDKSVRIYSAIRDSLPVIRFFDTVTNLKLETRQGRLHVHVTEDANEIICYPPVAAVEHSGLAGLRRIRESEIHFESHLSGFVYKVRCDNKLFIKKEIPAPDMIDEFLYELNALTKLRGEPNVIQLEGVIVDDKNQTVRGLLLHYARNGALVDLIFEQKDDPDFRSWARREKWARQIINGLCAIHEKGFVQGDFTLSNIVIDADDNARVIDINRRGCPVGWEPPEFTPIIRSGSRISMFIGVKSDLYQLGMVLWGLAMRIDEPERKQLLDFEEPEGANVPRWFRHVVNTCLEEDPTRRVAAKRLLRNFPRNHYIHLDADEVVSLDETSDTIQDDAEYLRFKPQYIHPQNAVERWDIEWHRSGSDIRRPPTELRSDSRNRLLDSAASVTPSTAPTEMTGSNLDLLPLHKNDAPHPKPANAADDFPASNQPDAADDARPLRIDTGHSVQSFAGRMGAISALRESPHAASPAAEYLRGVGDGVPSTLLENLPQFVVPHQDSGYGDEDLASLIGAQSQHRTRQTSALWPERDENDAPDDGENHI